MDSQPAVSGKEAALRKLDACWQSFGAVEHDIDGDEPLPLPGRRRHALRAVAITSVRFYTDARPLF